MLDRSWGRYGHAAPSRRSLDGRVSGILGNLAGVLDLETGFGYLLWRLRRFGDDPLYDVPDFRSWLAWKAADRLTSYGDGHAHVAPTICPQLQIKLVNYSGVF
jgi:hypothetical protein